MRLGPSKIQWRRLTQGGDQFIVHDLDDLLPRVQCLRNFRTNGAFADASDEGFDDAKVHIGFQESKAHFAHRGIHVRFRKFAATPELVKDLIESICEIFKLIFYGSIGFYQYATEVATTQVER
jgi:hypothetical protein